MLKHKRPAYSEQEKEFCDLFIKPVFGEPDRHGNYIKRVGDNPTIAFTAHTDTVHEESGTQKLQIKNDIVTTIDGDCLGADCTTGLWLMLGMIESNVEGVYVAHAAEEIGGVGSTNLVKDNPEWLSEIKVCLSFDRFGKQSVITHQSGRRTASDEFALSIAKILKMPELQPDTTGTYTDSMEYTSVVAECSNLSVGYEMQHTKHESQNIEYAEMLLERLREACWDQVEVSREPNTEDPYEDALREYYSTQERYEDEQEIENEIDSITKLMYDNPRRLAEFLQEVGLTVDVLCDEMNLSYSDQQYYKDEYASKTYH